MKNILLIGGMGSGKNTLGIALRLEVPKLHYIYVSKYAARIPMTLISSTHPDLLDSPKSEYIDTILKNEGIELKPFQRQEMDEYGMRVMEEYGKTIFAETAIRATKPEIPNLVDNIPLVENVQYLKDRGFYVVGLECSFEAQVRRCLKRGKDIDPSNTEELEEQIKGTNEFFDIEKTLKLADKVYNTDTVRADVNNRVREIIDV